jgi:adenine-specific DNA-methyltransferase
MKKGCMKKGLTRNSRQKQAQLGQFLTPSPVANFMASMFDRLPQNIRLLDAGAGAGELTMAFVLRCCNGIDGVRSIDAALYEVDGDILDDLAETMRECEQLCASAGIHFSFTVHHADFIQEASARLAGELFGASSLAYDISIANPPYRKIHTHSTERRALRSIGVETSNLYTGFVSLIRRLLAPGGQFVGITPRSFCNGPYFRPFRDDFLGQMSVRRIHVFDSRQAAFRDDRVLQENVIIHAVRGERQATAVLISSSSGDSASDVTELVVPYTDVVHPYDPERFIHIPSSASHAAAKEMMSGLSTRLDSLNLSVSTGRVVDFRLKSALRKEAEPGTVPLLYPCHFNAGTVYWPMSGTRKPNAILDNDETRPWLVPANLYLLVKRFTAKEEHRRVVACVLDPSQLNADLVGIENHLNYFHANGRGVERDLAVGLYAFLNSTVVDQYFRRFSGHTQVNAADLRGIPYPKKETLQAIGREIPVPNLTQEEIDEIVDRHLHGNR